MFIGPTDGATPVVRTALQALGHPIDSSRVGETEYLELLMIMGLEDRLDKTGYRMLVQVGGNVTDAQAALRRRVVVMPRNHRSQAGVGERGSVPSCPATVFHKQLVRSGSGVVVQAEQYIAVRLDEVGLETQGFPKTRDGLRQLPLMLLGNTQVVFAHRRSRV